MRIIINLGVILATCVITASSAMAQQLGFNFTTPATGQDNGASFAVTGFRFQVTSAVTISALAAFDRTAPAGIGAAVADGGGDIKVGLWDDSSTLLASVSVPVGTLPISGTYFSAVAITPITLQTGFYRIADDGYRTYVSGSPSGFAGYTSAPGLTYVTDIYSASGNGFAFPNFSDSYSYLNVSFVSTAAIPEPSTYAAIFGGVALVGACLIRRRRAS